MTAPGRPGIIHRDSVPPDHLLGLATAHLGARALHVIAELGTADALAAGPRTAEELARDADANSDALHRLLRLLETHGLFSCDDAGRWANTPGSQRLRSDHPMSLRPFVRMSGQPINWGAFTALDRTLRTGEPGLLAVDPDGLWAYYDTHPDQRAVFNQAMSAKAHGDIAAVLGSYDFSRHRRIADIGGGNGHLIAAILAATTDTGGVLFDLPQVVAEVPPAPRLEIVGGDFFTDPVPACDAYLIMQTVHDWDDEQATAILAAVARAGRPAAATVLLVEMVLPEGPEPHTAKILDVMMLAVTGGRERTRAQYATLLDGAGIELIDVISTDAPVSIIEARVR